MPVWSDGRELAEGGRQLIEVIRTAAEQVGIGSGLDLVEEGSGLLLQPAIKTGLLGGRRRS